MPEVIQPVRDSQGNIVEWETIKTEIKPLYMPEDERIKHLAAEALANEMIKGDGK